MLSDSSSLCDMCIDLHQSFHLFELSQEVALRTSFALYLFWHVLVLLLNLN